MKDKIYKYLKQKGEKVAPQEIITKIFHTNKKYPRQMEKIVDNLLRNDKRFVRDETGLWGVKERNEDLSLGKLDYIIIDFEYITLNKQKIPVIFGFAEIRKLKIISKHLFSLKPRPDLNEKLKKDIKYSKQENVSAKFEEAVLSNYKFLSESLLIVCFSQKIENDLNMLLNYHLGIENELQTIHLKNVLSKLIPEIKTKNLEDIADYFELSYQIPLNLQNRLLLTHEIMSLMIEDLHEREIFTLNQFINFIHENENLVDFSEYNFNREYIANLPCSPGVYLLKDKFDKIIYVGKSKNLKSRVQSYFFQRPVNDEKIELIQENIFKIVYEQTGSELEALLLENRYIHQFEPVINKQIEIHKSTTKFVISRKIVLLMPSLIERHVLLYFINSDRTAFHCEIDRENPDWNEIEKQFNKLLQIENDSDYTSEQIEIIWRWFAMNKDVVNHIDIEAAGDSENFISLLYNYITDENLFRDKIHYI